MTKKININNINIDWSLIFTNTFRDGRMQEVMDDMFKGRNTTRVTPEELEYMVIRMCTMMMNKLNVSVK